LILKLTNCDDLQTLVAKALEKVGLTSVNLLIIDYQGDQSTLDSLQAIFSASASISTVHNLGLKTNDLDLLQKVNPQAVITDSNESINEYCRSNNIV